MFDDMVMDNDINSVNAVLDVASVGITFVCPYLNDYPFEIPMNDLTFSTDCRGVFVIFTCLCGRKHESTIN